MEHRLTGGCLCGAVRYRLAESPVEALYCHCRMCQRAHGAPVVAWLTVQAASLAMTAGEPVAYRSSATVLRHFCGRCGTPLTWRTSDNPQVVDVSIATLDEPALASPTLHIWTKSRVPWLKIADSLPRHSTNRRPRTDV